MLRVRFCFTLGWAFFLLSDCSSAWADSSVSVPKDVLSLIVSGEDNAHLKASLEHLVWLKKNRGVRIGNIYILNFSGAAEPGFPSAADEHGVENAILGLDPLTRSRITSLLEPAKRNARRVSRAVRSPKEPSAGLSESALEQYAAEAGVSSQEVLDSEKVFSRLKITNSPSWVVRHRGADYVLEGFTDLTKLFNEKGEFIRDAW